MHRLARITIFSLTFGLIAVSVVMMRGKVAPLSSVGASPLPGATQFFTPTATLLPVASSTPAPVPTVLPKEVMLDVPFIVQAPLGKWDTTHEEACEEASLLMLQLYVTKSKDPNSNDIEKSLQDLIAFETNHGYGPDVTMAEVAAIATSYFYFAGTVHTTVSEGAIKKELAAGKPVLVPAAGRLLPNPHFKSPGPVYHMLIIKGYDKDGFITNDPGTKFGENFHYSFPDLLNAIHDWNSQDILQGGKVYFILN